MHVDTHMYSSLNELIPLVANELATAPLCKLVNLLEAACKHNFVSALLLLGGANMSRQYAIITTQVGGFLLSSQLVPQRLESQHPSNNNSLFGMVQILSTWKDL